MRRRPAGPPAGNPRGALDRRPPPHWHRQPRTSAAPTLCSRCRNRRWSRPSAGAPKVFPRAGIAGDRSGRHLGRLAFRQGTAKPCDAAGQGFSPRLEPGAWLGGEGPFVIDGWASFRAYVRADFTGMGQSIGARSILFNPVARFTLLMRFYEYLLNTGKPAVLRL